MVIVGKKVILFAIVSLFVFGVISLAPAESHKVYAAPGVSTVGVVDYGQLINGHPDTPKANETLKAEQELAKKEFAEKSAGLGDQEKKDLDRQLSQRVEQKRQELLKVITDKINAAIKEVADAKGLSVVLGKNTVIYGGLDITDEVMKKLAGK
jgi:outer membrane protein